MALYEYRCDRHGVTAVARPIGQATATVPCAVCDGAAARVFTAPMLSLAPQALVAAIDRCEKTRDEPPVVTSLPRRDPSKRTTVAPWTPALARLPKP